MVNIIMPTYNAHDTIRQSIASVATQDDLDKILLTIIDDCSDEPYNYIIDDFHYMKIEILKKPSNTGCGQSRQYGIDRCKCKYFMFLDADDCLYSPFVVKQMYSFMEKDNLDLLYTDFIEELSDGRYFLRQNSGVWMHGKMFKTKYIQENNIRYNQTRLHEDHAFNTISVLCGGKSRYIDSVTYLWKYYEKSLTRYAQYNLNSITNFIINAEYTISELIKRNIEKQIVCGVLKKYTLSFYKYYNIMLNEHLPNKHIGKFIQSITQFFANIPCEIKDNITEEYLRENFYQDDSIVDMINNNIIFIITFDRYCQQINIEKSSENILV